MARAGAPTLFGEHLVEEIRGYLAPFIEYAENMDDESAPRGIPTQAGASIRIGVSKSALSDWKLTLKVVDGDPVLTNENVSQFKELMSKLEALQEIYTIHRGLLNQYNATIGKVVLARHGYADKVDSVSSDGSMSPKRDFNDMYKDED